MARVLARRDINRQTLQQYILDDAETFEILGPGRVPLHRGRRDFSWYVRDGLHVRSPVRFDGVTVGEEDRRKYEEDWIRRERERLERRAKRAPRKPARTPRRAGRTAGRRRDAGRNAALRVGSLLHGLQVRSRELLPRRAGAARRPRRPADRVLPDPDVQTTNAIGDRRTTAAERNARPRHPSARERKQEEDINRKMNKTALVTLWVDPAEHQIVKYTFDNVWMDFLPGAWLVRVDDIHASMSMGQPFPGVWLPREMDVHAAVSLATGPLEASYARQFTNYSLAEVKSIIRRAEAGGA